MPPPDRPEQGRDGVLFTLRRIEHLLEELAERYRRVAGGLPRRRGLYERFSAECREDAQTVEKLLERALR